MCAGCVAPVVVRMMSMAAKDRNVVVANATGCLEVATTIYPYTAWKCSWIHNAFENAGATISGVEAAYKSLKRQGKIKDDYKFIAFGGDGGTYDIGLQSLSGAMERGHDIVYVCYDNGAYMNTGIQRSGATPKFADTTTSPAGKVVPGKTQWRKDLTAIMVAHNIPYAAQVAPSHWRDFITKGKKAIDVDGPAFINALAPCPRGWRYDTAEGIEMCRLAVETCVWPLYEVVDGEWKLTYKPKEKRPVADYLKAQGRFRHMTEEMIQEFQEQVDRDWEALLKRCGEA
ncbi:MAG: thiamine pyrophosphate-dependent enzyme [bacterium]|jgi:pyruvate ferredoxin oxidoreductase beta subunit|nr:thiamine pyrophosphate-dependent enzyme [Bacillota bacterium]HHW55625.1 pyruvate ferredoxin oxidoreductase [Bacillota bacterium]